MSDTGVRIPSARSKKPFLTTKYRPQLLKKHSKSNESFVFKTILSKNKKIPLRQMPERNFAC